MSKFKNTSELLSETFLDTVSVQADIELDKIIGQNNTNAMIRDLSTVLPLVIKEFPESTINLLLGMFLVGYKYRDKQLSNIAGGN